jgi:photosystem II stability/assembly factor-like uncharacterized protein
MPAERANSLQMFLVQRNKIFRKALLALFTLALAFLSVGHDAHGYLWDVYFASPLKGWVAGEDNILSTADGGLTWKSQKLSGVGAVAIAFQTPDVGWIFGFTRFFRTTDGGETWQNWRPPVSAALGIYFATPKTGWIPTNRDHVFKTDDGGRTWKRQPVNVDNPAVIACFSERECIIGGMKGAVLSTSDGGGRWVARKIPAGEASIGQIRVTPDGTAWALGFDQYKTYVLRSDDRGQSWKLVNFMVPPDRSSLFFWNRKRGLTVGVGIDLTEDGGVTWTTVATPDVFYLNSVHFVDEHLGWAVGVNAILQTKDGGKTWVRQYLEP